MEQRLGAVRALMASAAIDVLWVRSTDRFLNEYVPLEESTRAWLTGFTGSVGEALVTARQAWLLVDGRYWLQAADEAKGFSIVQVPLGQSLEQATEATIGAWLKDAGKKKPVIGYEPERFSVAELQRVQKALDACEWRATSPSLIERARGELATTARPLRVVDEKKLDQTSAQKTAAVGKATQALGGDALLVQTLDEIAWLSNLRGDDLPYQATFRSIALCMADKLIIGVSDGADTQAARAARPHIQFVRMGEFAAAIASVSKNKSIVYDPRLTTASNLAMLQTIPGCKPLPCPSPIGPMKAKKGPKELKAMTAAFARADKVVQTAIDWLCSEVSKRKVVSEADFAAQVEALFRASGATGLSFAVISAAGRNGAVIHYSKPNKKRVIKQGELMLLDTGAYYEDGYATDLTRTFLVGPKSQKATAEQKRYFTLVLKAAVAGMRARLPFGARGDQLDAITRAPLWAAGLNYNHGTGHGVGINVHEFPPRISTQGTAPLEEGMVFSIEPGVYLDRFGGVRIENLCTLERPVGVAGFLQVKPLTFSPLDTRLIDRKLLNDEERAWLAQYMRGRAPK